MNEWSFMLPLCTCRLHWDKTKYYKDRVKIKGGGLNGKEAVFIAKGEFWAVWGFIF